MTEEPLKAAVREIGPKLDEELQPLIAALLADQSIDETWEELLREILHEA